MHKPRENWSRRDLPTWDWFLRQPATRSNGLRLTCAGRYRPDGPDDAGVRWNGWLGQQALIAQRQTLALLSRSGL